jgi:altronate hydrolase
MTMQKKLIKVNPTDNVAVALVNLTAGESISFEGEDIVIESDVKMKHKIALNTLDVDQRIIMYGVLVGKASAKIEKGGLLTTANVKHESAKVSGKTETIGWTVPNIDKWKGECMVVFSIGFL